MKGFGDVSVLPGLVGVREMGVASSEARCGSPGIPGATVEGCRGHHKAQPVTAGFAGRFGGQAGQAKSQPSAVNITFLKCELIGGMCAYLQRVVRCRCQKHCTLDWMEILGVAVA